MKLELLPQLPRAMVPSAPPDEYTASRNGPVEPDSFRALEVAQMNREQEQWTKAQAPNVFSEGVDT